MKIALNVEAVGARRGGAEKYAGALARSLAAAGHQVHVVAREVDAGELPVGSVVHRVRARTPLGLGWLRSFKFAQQSQRVLESESFDLIIGLVKTWYQHAYIAVGGAHPASLASNSRRFRSPVRRALWWAGKLLSPKQWVYKWIERRQFDGSHAPHVIVPAQTVAEDFQHYHHVSPQRISVIPWGLDVSQEPIRPEQARADFRRQHRLGADDVAILFVARNYALKGLDPLLESFAAVVQKHPQSRLLVCGSRRDRAARRRAKQFGVDAQVQFLGFVDDIQAAFAGADVFAFPTFYDPCSLVVLEAMRAGLPVVTTRRNGASELITDGRDGFVIDDSWNVTQLGRRLAQLVADRPLRQRMGTQAKIAAARFSIADHSRALLAALTKAAADPLASPRLRNAA